jgi:hypothetical protein
MKHLVASCLMASFTVGLATFAQPPVTATCKDGTSFSGTSRRGACSAHGGVQTWGIGTAPGAEAPAPVSPAPPHAQATGGGGAGQVWVNTASRVYHCPGDRYFGKTKHGAYMTETAAKAAGDRPSHGKACS